MVPRLVRAAGCTAEACSFRDSFEVFRDAGASVVGVSRDSVASHKSFAAHHRLPFTLLADGGMDDLEVIRWLFTPDDALSVPGAPMDALEAGFKTEVRRRAQVLAF